MDICSVTITLCFMKAPGKEKGSKMIFSLLSCRSLLSLPALNSVRKPTLLWQAGNLLTELWSPPSLTPSSSSKRTLSAENLVHLLVLGLPCTLTSVNNFTFKFSVLRMKSHGIHSLYICSKLASCSSILVLEIHSRLAVMANWCVLILRNAWKF